MPSFIETLEVTDVFMGTCIPQLHSVSNVVADEFGVWFDFDFTYNGSFQMTLQTKLKMPKTKNQMQSDEQTDNPELKQRYFFIVNLFLSYFLHYALIFFIK